MSTRTADYTIQGFIYQFIVTFHKLLVSVNDEEITVEGIIEDIDITTPTGQEAIQCKYHESKQKFTLSTIYKPVLQMLCHYKKNPTANIKYRLHAHFPNETVGSNKVLTKEELDSILESKAVDLKTYITELSGFKGGNEFLKRFTIEFGASLADTEKTVIVCLSSEGFTTEDVTEIFYPNAIHTIAELSIQHEENKRKIKKTAFLNELRKKKKTAISRWTKELQSYEKLLTQRRKQLYNILQENTRKRAIVLDTHYLSGSEDKIPMLMKEYIDKYNNKIRLHQCPVFSLICNEGTLNKIWAALNTKKMRVERGIVAGVFDINHFLREPMKSFKDGGNVEFNMKLCNHDNDFETVLTKEDFDDLLLISDKKFPFEEQVTCNIEKIKTSEFNEIRYLLSLTKTI